jgi:hypothetical protein
VTNTPTPTATPTPGCAAGPVTSNLALTPNPAPINTAVQLTATETASSGTVASAQYRIDAGAYTAMAASDGSFNTSTENVKATIPAFATSGVYKICVRGTDSYGNTGCEVCTFLAVYDANNGFVTGGGWINSPAGAYYPNPTLTGTANFGFVSKYAKGQSIPSGDTQFQFQEASFNFKSTSYDWLVISGPQAQYKGSGTINGAGDYGFMLTGVDGTQAGGGGTDKFRLKVWNKTTNAIIYDNLLNAPDSTTPTTVLGGGNIVIHK